MDCNTARLLLEFAAPVKAAELEPTDAGALDAHLAACADCAASARAQRKFDDEVGKAVRRVEVPDRLRDLLHQRLNADAVHHRRRWLRRLLVGVGTAAGVLLVLGLGFAYWRQQSRPEVHPEQVYNDLRERQVQTPDPEDLDSAYRLLGVETVVPRGLKYKYLLSHGLEEFQGRMVPALIFRDGDRFARVLILSDREFNFQDLHDYHSPRDDDYQKLKIELTADRHFAYLIAYLADDLGWLRQRGAEAPA
jgi:hypothetical protein